MFNAVKVFSATLFRDRAQLGEMITAWLADNPAEIVEVVVRQSSDASYHCLSVTLFYKV